ncbi:MAG: hypothetical protein RBR71_11460 [Gudongella sp.]|nr:hypothetical protein [Gudongella sp.]
MLIGAPAAGKSTYISASYGHLYYDGITTDTRRFRHDKDMTLSYNSRLLEKFNSYRNGYYPLPDADFFRYSMDILWDGKTVGEIEWIDMAGGDIFSTSARQSTVRRNLRECDAVIAFYAVDNIITHDQQKFDDTVGMICEMCELIEYEIRNRSRPLMVSNVFTKSDLASQEEKDLIWDQLKEWLTYDGAESITYFTTCVPPEIPTPVPMVGLMVYAMYYDYYYRGLKDKLRVFKNRKIDNLQSGLINYLERECPKICWYRWRIKD